MRNFIYLDTDFLASFMSQEHDGLEKLRILEELDSKRNCEGTPTITKSVVGKVSAGGIAGGECSSSIESAINMVEASELYRETVTRVLHDNIFTYFDKYLGENKNILSNKENIKAGNYIKITDNYKFIDIELLETIASKKFLECMKEVMTMNADKVQAANIKANLDKEAKAIQKIFPNIFYLIKTFIPTQNFIIMNNMLILIDKRFLREENRMIEFKYNGEISIVGKVNRLYSTETNIIDEIPSPNEDFLLNIVEPFNDIAIEILKLIINPKTQEIYIVTPIAIYF